MREVIDAQLKANVGWARLFGLEDLANFMEHVLSNPGLLDFVVGLIERNFNKAQATESVGTFSAESLGESDKEYFAAQAIDIGKIIQMVQLFMELYKSFKPKMESMGGSCETA